MCRLSSSPQDDAGAAAAQEVRSSKRLRWSADSSSGGTFASTQDLLVSRERSGGSDLVSVPEDGLQLQVRVAAWYLLTTLTWWRGVVLGKEMGRSRRP